MAYLQFDTDIYTLQSPGFTWTLPLQLLSHLLICVFTYLCLSYRRVAFEAVTTHASVPVAIDSHASVPTAVNHSNDRYHMTHQAGTPRIILSKSSRVRQ